MINKRKPYNNYTIEPSRGVLPLYVVKFWQARSKNHMRYNTKSWYRFFLKSAIRKGDKELAKIAKYQEKQKVKKQKIEGRVQKRKLKMRKEISVIKGGEQE